LAQTGFFGSSHNPAADFRQNVAVLAHGRTHLALRQTVRAGEVQFKSVHAGFLAAFDDFEPGILAIFLHDGGDQNAVGKHVFALLEFVQPDLERPVADQFDVLPTDDFPVILAHQLGVAGRDVDDFGRVEADRFGDDGAPTFFERFGDDV